MGKSAEGSRRVVISHTQWQLPLKAHKVVLGSTSLMFHTDICVGIEFEMLYHVSRQMISFQRFVVTLITLQRLLFMCRFAHFLFNKCFCCEYSHPHSVLNNVANLCEPVIFLCVPIQIPSVHESLLAHNTRNITNWFSIVSSVVQFFVPSQVLLCRKRLVAQVARVIDGTSI